MINFTGKVPSDPLGYMMWGLKASHSGILAKQKVSHCMTGGVCDLFGSSVVSNNTAPTPADITNSMHHMNKLLPVAILSYIAGSPTVHAKLKGQFGIEYSPCLSINRVHVKTISANNNEASDHPDHTKFKGLYKPRLHLGVHYYSELQRHVSFGLGLRYMPGHATLHEPSTWNIQSNRTTADRGIFTHAIGIPIGLQLYTNELATDLSIYNKIGVTPWIIFKKNGNTTPSHTHTTGISAILFIGTGIKYDFSIKNSLTCLLSFHIDLLDIIRDQKILANKQTSIANHFLSLDIGLLF